METVLKSLSLRRFVKATGYATAGVYYAFLNEPSFLRIGLLEVILAISIGWFLWPISFIEVAILVMAAALVLITEIINTSIEILADIVQPEKDVKVKRIKDCAAGATFIATCSGMIACTLIIYFHMK